MAQVWIEKVIHSSPSLGEVVLKQNDITKHPVINGVQYADDKPIRVQPGDSFDATWFVIPWENTHRRLRVEYAGRAVDYTVGPIDANSEDYLRADDGASGTRIGAAKMGARGDNNICSVSLHLLIANDKLDFQFRDASGSYAIDAKEVTDALLKLLEIVSNFFK